MRKLEAKHGFRGDGGYAIVRLQDRPHGAGAPPTTVKKNTPAAILRDRVRSACGNVWSMCGVTGRSWCGDSALASDLTSRTRCAKCGKRSRWSWLFLPFRVPCSSGPSGGHSDVALVMELRAASAPGVVCRTAANSDGITLLRCRSRQPPTCPSRDRSQARGREPTPESKGGS